MSISVTFESDISMDGGSLALIPTSAVERFKSELGTKIPEALKKPAGAAEDTAMAVHRYESRTGRLKNSTKFEVNSYGDIGAEVEGYLDNSAPYGEYIIKGKGTWAADPFLENASSTHQVDFESAIDDAVEEALETFLREI
jgi:hypothetical protein